MMSLSHPNIVRLQEVYRPPSGDRIYMVLDRLEGGSVDGLWRKQGKLSEDHAAHIILQVVSAVRYCHDKGIAVSFFISRGNQLSFRYHTYASAAVINTAARSTAVTGTEHKKKRQTKVQVWCTEVRPPGTPMVVPLVLPFSASPGHGWCLPSMINRALTEGLSRQQGCKFWGRAPSRDVFGINLKSSGGRINR